MMMAESFLEPVRFFTNPRLLSGWNASELPDGTLIVTDLDEAMLLENSQELPSGYKIWADFFPNAISEVYTSPAGTQGRPIIEETANDVWAGTESFQAELRKKRSRKTATEYELFWLATGYDILEHLKIVALSRYCQPNRHGGDIERVYRIYFCGFYPCGIRVDGTFAAFDPRVLQR
jgi:hypothetical protein